MIPLSTEYAIREAVALLRALAQAEGGTHE